MLAKCNYLKSCFFREMKSFSSSSSQCLTHLKILIPFWEYSGSIWECPMELLNPTIINKRLTSWVGPTPCLRNVHGHCYGYLQRPCTVQWLLGGIFPGQMWLQKSFVALTMLDFPLVWIWRPLAKACKLRGRAPAISCKSLSQWLK